MKNILLKFIEKTGKNSEFELFLNMFHNLPKIKFAVIKISGETLENHLDLIAEDIAYLNKLEIYPVIVHGAGSMLDRKLPLSKKIDGIRVTSKQDIEIIKNVLDNISNKLKDKIIAKGGSAEKVDDLFECGLIDEVGYVGEIKKIRISKIKAAIDKNATPIISPIGKYKEMYLNINADSAAKEVVKAIAPKKFILVTETGGILDENKQIMPFLDLSSEDEFKHITGGMLLKVEEMKEFLKTKPDCAVVITSASDLLKEIFTIKGSGTFLKYHVIKHTFDIGSLNKAKLKWLLEDAFEKKLADDYFDDGIQDVFYQKDYEGAAIVKEVNGIPYLDKFAVAKFCQGTGLGKSLWLKLTKKYPKLVWRSTPGNPINGLYISNCHGMIKKPEWNIYWTNLDDSEILPTVEAAANKRKTMI